MYTGGSGGWEGMLGLQVCGFTKVDSWLEEKLSCAYVLGGGG
jgi:hypothetical protein